MKKAGDACKIIPINLFMNIIQSFVVVFVRNVEHYKGITSQVIVFPAACL